MFSPPPTDPATAGPVAGLTTLLASVAVVGVALALTLLLRRMGRARAFRGLHRILPAAQILLWIVVSGRLASLWIAPLSGARLGLAGLGIALAGLAALPILRDIVGGLAFAFETRWAIGDDVRIGATEGRITALGIRSLHLLGRNGAERALPYSEVLRQPITRLPRASSDPDVEFVLRIPAGLAPETALAEGHRAAALSPLASPHYPPEVFLELDHERRPSLRIRGFVCAREHEERYRSDVSHRLLDAFPPPASEAREDTTDTTDPSDPL